LNFHWLVTLQNHYIATWLFLQVKIFRLFSPGTKPDSIEHECVARLFRAFASVTIRLAIMQALKSGPLSVSGMVEKLSTRPVAVSKKLK
jgi:hypothetical protein